VCFPVGNFLVLYEPLDDGILMLPVIHGARDIPHCTAGSSLSNSDHAPPNLAVV